MDEQWQLHGNRRSRHLVFYFPADPLNNVTALWGCEELRAPWRKEALSQVLFHKLEGTAHPRASLLFTALCPFTFQDLRKMGGYEDYLYSAFMKCAVTSMQQ